MGRLYPRMRERPSEFRLNPTAPLANALVLAWIPSATCWGSMRMMDLSPYSWHGELQNISPSYWKWSPHLNRIVTEHNTISVNRIVLAHNPFFHFDGSSFSVSIWAYARTWAGTTRIFEKQEAEKSPYQGWTLLWWSGSLGFSVGDTAGVSAKSGFSSPPINTWLHLVGVYHRGSHIILYANGVAQNPGTDKGVGSLATTRALTVGNYDPGTRSQNFNGFLGDAMIWSRPLSAAEVQAMTDPSNVDLRVGGVPLILPPRRRFWPVVSEQAIPKMVPWHLFQQVSA